MAMDGEAGEPRPAKRRRSAKMRIAEPFQMHRMCARLNAVPMPALLNRPSQRFRRRSHPHESFPDLFSFALQAESDADLPTQERELPHAFDAIPASLAHHPAFDGWMPPCGITPFHEQANGCLFLGDSLRWLSSLPSRSVDMVFADPPYGIGKAEWDVFPDEAAYLAWCDQWVGEVARILTPTGTCYICGFSEILADVKFTVQRHFRGCRWIVWHYRNKANLGNDWGRSHESILHFRKSSSTALNVDDIRIPYGAHTLKYPARTQAETSAFAKSAPAKGSAWTPNPLGAKPKDVLDIPTTCNGMGEKTPHPTQKPEELLRKLVLASSNPGDWVLDPFSGSGTTLVAAEQLGRRWLGCDLSAEYNEWAVQRLRSVQPRSVADWIAFDRETAMRRESIR